MKAGMLPLGCVLVTLLASSAANAGDYVLVKESGSTLSYLSLPGFKASVTRPEGDVIVATRKLLSSGAEASVGMSFHIEFDCETAKYRIVSAAPVASDSGRQAPKTYDNPPWIADGPAAPYGQLKPTFCDAAQRIAKTVVAAASDQDVLTSASTKLAAKRIDTPNAVATQPAVTSAPTSK